MDLIQVRLGLAAALPVVWVEGRPVPRGWTMEGVSQELQGFIHLQDNCN